MALSGGLPTGEVAIHREEALVNETSGNDFEKLAAEPSGGTFLAEFWEFLRHNKYGGSFRYC